MDHVLLSKLEQDTVVQRVLYDVLEMNYCHCHLTLGLLFAR